MYSFGSGVLLGTRTDTANATPINFGLVQEVTIEEAATIKELSGQFQRPVAIARGSIKTTGKAKVARISGIAFANLFYGVTPSAGQLATSFAEVGTVSSAAPFTYTVVNAASFVDDEGLLYAATGLPLTKVSATPSFGQYSVASGVYTLNSTDSGKAILASYTYTISGSGEKFTVTNQLLGTTPTFQAVFYSTFQGQAISLKLNNCTSNKLSFHTKLEDFVMPEFDFSCFADPAGNVMTWSFAEAS
ncbi:hypothetical protein QEV83_05065 [Methylocapsa sp. D3K7]|uniref:hypothetical protein n=1 Tax=Methylocapsa sp. D3K7 TaxID=3041435 RepID=UPI00244E8D6E|nr:hypothetical protein [Methylocapsa sp. D3K7]WGJ15637.1 hypothetical protein QEV83_05065 [Methylocapsa sp. D3K7]